MDSYDHDRDRDRDSNGEESRSPDGDGWLAELIGVLERLARSASESAPESESESESEFEFGHMTSGSAADPKSEPVDRRSEPEGRRDRSRRIIDYDVSVRTGIGESGGERGPEPEPEPEMGPDSDATSSPGPDPDPDSTSSSSHGPHTARTLPDHRITTRRYDDEFFITADLPNVDVDAITVGLADTTLVIGIDGRELKRIPLPWEDATANAMIHNDILTVTIGSEVDDQ